MLDSFNEMDSNTRQSYSLGLSVGLHVVILFLMLFNFSWATDDFEKSPPALLMVDLTKVQLGDKTNLPPKVEEKKKEAPKAVEPTPKPQKEDKTPTVKQEPLPPKPEEVKPKEAPTPKDAVKMQEPKKEPQKKETPKKEPIKKPEPKKPVPPKPTPQKNTSAGGLQSLLASVEKVRKPINTPSTKTAASSAASTGQEVNKGIEGGTGGSLTEALTISEKDLIANKIRQCWNVNAGVEGAEQMIIELRAYVNKDGRIREVKILNMKSDPVFRSMAESAKRAIYVCDGLQEDSPFKILATQHPETYSSWKELYLRMNPIDGGVF